MAAKKYKWSVTLLKSKLLWIRIMDPGWDFNKFRIRNVMFIIIIRNTGSNNLLPDGSGTILCSEIQIKSKLDSVVTGYPVQFQYYPFF